MGSENDGLMKQALGILRDEGFTLPEDVIETLTSFGRSQHGPAEDSTSPDADGRPGPSRSGIEVSHTDRNIRQWTDDGTSARGEPGRPFYESGYDTMASEGGNRGRTATRSYDRPHNDEVFTKEDLMGGARWSMDDDSRRQSLGGGMSSESTSTATTVRDATKDRDDTSGAQLCRSNRDDSASSMTSPAAPMDKQVYAGDSGSESMGHNLITTQEAEARVDNIKNLHKDLEQTLAGRGNTELVRDISYDSGFSDSTKLRKEEVRESFNKTLDGGSEKGSHANKSTSHNAVTSSTQGEVVPTPASSKNVEVHKSETKKSSSQSSSKVTTGSQHDMKMEIDTHDEMTTASAVGRGDSLVCRQDSCSQRSHTSETSTATAADIKDSDEPLAKSRVIKKDLSQEQKSISSKLSTADGVITEETKSTSSGSDLKMTQDMKTSVDESGKVQTEEKRTSDTKHTLAKEDKVAKTEDRVDPVTGQKHLVTETSVDKDETASIASTFTGQCSVQEEVDGQILKRTLSTDKSDSSTSKNTLASKSITSSPTPRLYVTANDNLCDEYVDGLYDSGRYSIPDDRSSVYSRQDSDASSIASSASAMHERQRLKDKLEAERKILRSKGSDETSRRKSLDSMTKLKQAGKSNYDSDRTDGSTRGSYSPADSYSTSKLNEEPIYQNVPYRTSYGDRDSINYLSPRNISQATHNRSRCHSSDSRRATLHGDVMLTDAELRNAREEVRRSVRGKDDSFLMRDTIDTLHSEAFTIPSALSPRLSDSPFSMMDDIWNSSDDFLFSPSFRTHFTTASALDMDPFFSDFGLSPRICRNPYSTRDDLTRHSSCDGSVASDDSFRPKSDSGVRSPYGRPKPTRTSFESDGSRGRKLDRNPRERSFTCVSADHAPIEDKRSKLKNSKLYDSDYDTKSLSSLMTDSGVGSQNLGKKYSADDIYTPVSRLYPNVNNAAGDTRKSAGQSINTDINASIINSRHDNVSAGRTIGNKNYNNGDTRSGAGQRNDLPRSDDSVNMSNGGRAPDSVLRRFTSGSEVTDGVEGVEPGTAGVQGQTRGTGGPGQIRAKDDTAEEKWDSRRQRIDKALSWIRSELGQLRGQDKVLLSQFQRCQQSIEQLKRQRPWFEVYSDDDEEEGDGEGDGEARHWQDWEIEDFDRSQAAQADRKGSSGPPKDGAGGAVVT